MKRKSHLLDPQFIKDTVLEFESGILKIEGREECTNDGLYEDKIIKYEKIGLLKLSDSEIEDYCYYLYLSSQKKGSGAKALKTLEQVLEHLCFTKLKPLLEHKTLRGFFHEKQFQFNVVNLLQRFKDYEADLIEEDPCYATGLPGYFPYPMCYLVNCKAISKKMRDSISFDVRSHFNEFHAALAEITMTQNNILSVIPLYDEILCGMLFPDVFSTMREERNTLFMKTVVQGMPSNTAYRIANAYMYGVDVPKDREKAKMWYIYGMTVGNPYCIMAYLLYYLDVDAEKEENASKVCACIYSFLVNAFMLMMRVKNEPKHPFLNFPLYDHGCDLEEVCIYNLLSFYNTLKYFSELDNLALLTPEFIGGFDEYLLDYVSKKNCSHRVKAQYAMFLNIEDVIEEDMDYEDMLITTLKLGRKNRDNPEKLLLKILEKGVLANDEDSLIAHLAIYGNYHDLKNDFDTENLKKLAELGNAQAAFSMGNILMHEKKEQEALKYWRVSADEGCAYAMINLALSAIIENNFEEALKYGKKALSYGNVYAYYIFYKYYEKKDQRLAHTYLRFAAEYFFPDAAKELWALKSAGQYEPLPFMQNIEKLEALSTFNVNACLILSEFYSAGVMFPENFLKSLLFRFRSINNGGTKYFDSFRRLYQNLPIPDIGFSNYFTSFRASLKKLEGFFGEESERNGESEEDRRVAFGLLNSVIEELCRGKTSLEHEILFNLYVYSKLSKTEKLLENYTKFVPRSMDYNTIFDILRRLLQGLYLTKDLFEDKSALETMCSLCQPYSKKEYDTYNYTMMKSMLAVRSFFMPPDYRTFRSGMKKCAASGSITGLALSALDFRMLFEEQKEEHIEDDDESLLGDVILSNTVQ